MSLTANGKLEVIENARLSEYTTFQLGGPCQKLYNCQTPQQLEQTVRELNAQPTPFVLIGGGSNIVVSDKGLHCSVIRYVSDEPLIELNNNEITVSGSTSFDALAEFAAEEGLEGLHTCHGIPGTVGGAIAGNAGAFGKQIGDVTKSVTVLDKLGHKEDINPETLEFSYRYSNLKASNDIVVSAVLSLTPGNKDELLKERDEILQTRREKHPNLAKEPCAGSFFRNIEPTSKAGQRQATGYILEQAGGKELTHGGAYIFPKHANIIIKGKNCTTEDVYELQKKMASLAKEKCDLDLVREVKFVGEFENQPHNDLIW